MLKFLDIETFTKNMEPITESEIFSRSKDFNINGLFSESIFGPLGTKDRTSTYSFIQLSQPIVHPSAIKILTQLDRKSINFLSAELTFKLNTSGLLEEDPDGITGISEFIKLFPEIKFRGGTTSREKLIKVLNESYKDGTLFISKLPVIPPDHRPAFQEEDGNWTVDPLNEYYQLIIRRSQQLSSAGSSGPLFNLLHYGLQASVIEHDSFIRTKVGKKTGIVRDQLLGKRVDFSGRAVITPGPDLKINEVGLPIKMAVTLFEPFILHQILHGKVVDKDMIQSEIKDYIKLDVSVESIKLVLKSIKNGDKIPRSLFDLFFEATELSMIGRVILIKRDPVLHSESYRAVKPILTELDTIQLCTLQVGGFGADFDGDTMAVFHPLTNEAQEEAKDKMMNLQGSTSSSSLIFELSKEMYVGMYLMTKIVPLKGSYRQVFDEDLLEETDPYKSVIYRGNKTSSGRAIFNSCLPKDYPFVDILINKKEVKKILLSLVKNYDKNVVIESVSKLEKISFKFATLMGTTITLDMIELPKSIYKLKEKLQGASTDEAVKLLKEMEKLLIAHLEGTGIHDLIESGSGKGWAQPMQILVAKGIIVDIHGNILPVISDSFADGLSVKQYFNASSGSRKGMIDRVLNTADTGYMARKLAYLLSPVEVHRTKRDCGTKRVLNLKLSKDISSRLEGRYIIDKQERLKEFRSNEYSIGDLIKLRTPIYCESSKVCHTCYGRFIEKHKSPYVGILAAQVIGERCTQLIMKSFHTGGAATLAKRNVIEDIVNNDPFSNIQNVSNLIKQTENNNIICLEDCKLTINIDDYEIGNTFKIHDNEESIWVKSLICKVEFSDSVFNIILDYPSEIQYTNIKKVDATYVINYIKNDILIFLPTESIEIKKQVAYVERLLGGREIYKDTDHLFLKIYKVYAGEVSDMDSIHLEVLLSQCLRDKNNQSYPARLGKKWNPVMVNIKKIVFSSGFIQGLSFENINEAIKVGLIQTEDLEPSILEDLLTGQVGKEK